MYCSAVCIVWLFLYSFSHLVLFEFNENGNIVILSAFMRHQHQITMNGCQTIDFMLLWKWAPIFEWFYYYYHCLYAFHIEKWKHFSWINAYIVSKPKWSNSIELQKLRFTIPFSEVVDIQDTQGSTSVPFPF